LVGNTSNAVAAVLVGTTSNAEPESLPCPALPCLALPCPGILPFGFGSAADLRKSYPLLRHGHEKVPWRYVDGIGLFATDPICSGSGIAQSDGSMQPCKPCECTRSLPRLVNWIKDARMATEGTQNWKLGFQQMTEKLAGHRNDKRSAIQQLSRVVTKCDKLLTHCQEYKALVLAIGQDDRPFPPGSASFEQWLVGRGCACGYGQSLPSPSLHSKR
jgi:hypothetical protein